MILPKYFRNSQSGQILIIFLLILVVGLAITLSIASRTVTDVRQTTTSDESNRAYFAAEAGVENALKKIEEGGAFAITGGQADVNLTSVNRSEADVDVVPLTVASSEVFLFPNDVARDEVSQLNTIYDFNDISTIATLTSLRRSERLHVYFGAEAASYSPLPAVEVSIISKNGALWAISKYTFDPDSTRRGAGGNGFCDATTDATGARATNTGVSVDFKYRAEVWLYDGSHNCPGTDNDTLTAGYEPVLARIRLLYNSVNLPLGVGALTGAGVVKALPSQGSKITSIGKTASGVTRKLTVTRLYPALPAIFDYVLYNGSASQPLSKP